MIARPTGCENRPVEIPGGKSFLILTRSPQTQQRRPIGRRRCSFRTAAGLQRRLNLEAPGLKQRLRDVLRVFVAPSPLPQTGRPNILVWAELELLDRKSTRLNS